MLLLLIFNIFILCQFYLVINYQPVLLKLSNGISLNWYDISARVNRFGIEEIVAPVEYNIWFNVKKSSKVEFQRRVKKTIFCFCHFFYGKKRTKKYEHE